MSPQARVRRLMSVMVVFILAAAALAGVPARAFAGTMRTHLAPPRLSFEQVSARATRGATVAPFSGTGSVDVQSSIAGVTAAGIGPINPIPASLWRPAPGSVPLSGNYVYLDSDGGDWIGQGREYLYTPATAAITVSGTGGYLSVAVDGNEWWYGDFKTMDTVTQMQPGYYPGLTRYPFHDHSMGGLDWGGEGRGSNTLTGWFVVDSATYSGGVLTAIDLRFELHSGGAAPALHGAIHWTADDATQPDGPVYPVPSGLWRPSAGSVPLTGNYVYLDSDPGDYIGAELEYLYTPAATEIVVSANGGHLSVSVDGWYGVFQAMSSIDRLEPGYYPGLERYPFHNPALGGLDWSGHGRGSNTLTGWFVVDRVAYTDGVLTSIDLRFEQHSEGAAPALHGAIHWSVGVPPVPTPGPHNIPGVALPPSPVTGTLDEAGPTDDVYAVDLEAGQEISFYLTGAPAADVWIFVYGPDATDVNVDTPLVGDTRDEYPKGGVFACTESGTYYVDLYAASGTGDYSLTWEIVQAGGPGRPPVAADDFFHTHRDTELVVDAPGVLENDLDLDSPSMVAQLVAAPLHGSLALDADGSFAYRPAPGFVGEDRFTYAASDGANLSETKTVTIDVRAPAVASDIPGDPLPSSPVMGRVDSSDQSDDVYRIHLSAGQRIRFTLYGESAVDCDLYVYGPGATSVYADDPTVWYDDDTYPKGGWFTAEESGTYYVDLYAADGAGAYALAWEIEQAPGALPVYRFYNWRKGVHFYTASEVEKRSVITRLWATYRYEGVSYSVNGDNPANGTPLYRFYNFKKGSHFYTASETEKNEVIARLSGTYRFEGTAYMVSASPVAGSLPVYRFYNVQKGVHFYTASEVERASVVERLSSVYRFEGAAYYIAP